MSRLRLAALLLLSTLLMGQLSPAGMRIVHRWHDGFCDIRGDCWWSGRYCHGCGVSETHPFVTNHFRPWMNLELKRGTLMYIPKRQPPVPKGLR